MKTPIQLTQDKVMELAKAESDPKKSLILTEVYGHLSLMEELEEEVIKTAYKDGQDITGDFSEQESQNYYNTKFKR